MGVFSCGVAAAWYPESFKNIHISWAFWSQKSHTVPDPVNKLNEETQWCLFEPDFLLDGTQLQQPLYFFLSYFVKTLMKEGKIGSPLLPEVNYNISPFSVAILEYHRLSDL